MILPTFCRLALQRRGAAAAALLHPHSGRGREVRHRILLTSARRTRRFNVKMALMAVDQFYVLVIYHKNNLTRSSHFEYEI